MLDIDDIFCIVGVGINNLRTPCHLIDITNDYLEHHYTKQAQTQINKNKFNKIIKKSSFIFRKPEPEVVALPASFAYQKQDPTGLVQLSQYQTP